MLSVHDHRRLVAFVATPIEIKLVDDAWCDRLMLLAQIKDQGVRRGGEDVCDGVGFVALDQPKMVRKGLGKGRRMPAAQDAALARTRRQRKIDQPADLRQ